MNGVKRGVDMTKQESLNCYVELCKIVGFSVPKDGELSLAFVRVVIDIFDTELMLGVPEDESFESFVLRKFGGRAMELFEILA